MILITGGAGFIGSVLARDLNKLGYKNLILVDRMEHSSKWKNLIHISFHELIHADKLFDKENERLLSKVNMIFHMGACSSTTETDMDFLLENNINYSKNLFKFASGKNIGFIYASSAATYGSGEQGYSDDHSKSRSLIPLNPYGFSKFVFDNWALEQQKTPAFWYGLKFFNVFGPNEYHKNDMRSLVCKAYEQILKTGKVLLFKSHRSDYEDGWQLRDFVYVKDASRAMIKMMDKGSCDKDGLYNLGTGKARSFYDLVKASFEAMNYDVKIEYTDMPEKIKDQYQYYTCADMKKFFSLLDDFSFLELEDAVKDYVSSHLSQEDSYY